MYNPALDYEKTGATVKDGDKGTGWVEEEDGRTWYEVIDKGTGLEYQTEERPVTSRLWLLT